MRRMGVFFIILFTAVFILQVNSYAQSGSGTRLDRDDNPPGAAGGPGTNWENPPGPRGGPGSGPDAASRSAAASAPAIVRQGRAVSPVRVVREENVQAPVVVKESVKSVPQVSPVAASFEDTTVVVEPWEMAVDTNRDGVVDVLELQKWHKIQHKLMDSGK